MQNPLQTQVEDVEGHLTELVCTVPEASGANSARTFCLPYLRSFFFFFFATGPNLLMIGLDHDQFVSSSDLVFMSCWSR